nr:MAG TPA: hypothetical protein [Caudoviricetes sp.]
MSNIFIINKLKVYPKIKYKKIKKIYTISSVFYIFAP